MLQASMAVQGIPAPASAGAKGHCPRCAMHASTQASTYTRTPAARPQKCLHGPRNTPNRDVRCYEPLALAAATTSQESSVLQRSSAQSSCRSRKSPACCKGSRSPDFNALFETISKQESKETAPAAVMATATAAAPTPVERVATVATDCWEGASHQWHRAIDSGCDSGFDGSSRQVPT